MSPEFTSFLAVAAAGFEIPPEALALVLAFIAGGTILNILRNELPDTDRPADVVAFTLGASAYAILVVGACSA